MYTFCVIRDTSASDVLILKIMKDDHKVGQICYYNSVLIWYDMWK